MREVEERDIKKLVFRVKNRKILDEERGKKKKGIIGVLREDSLKGTYQRGIRGKEGGGEEQCSMGAAYNLRSTFCKIP